MSDLAHELLTRCWLSNGNVDHIGFSYPQFMLTVEIVRKTGPFVCLCSFFLRSHECAQGEHGGQVKCNWRRGANK